MSTILYKPGDKVVIKELVVGKDYDLGYPMSGPKAERLSGETVVLADPRKGAHVKSAYRLESSGYTVSDECILRKVSDTKDKVEYDVGDTVVLTSTRPGNWNLDGDMDKYLGNTVVINSIGTSSFSFDGCDNWRFDISDIDHKVDTSHQNYKVGDRVRVVNSYHYTDNNDGERDEYIGMTCEVDGLDGSQGAYIKLDCSDEWLFFEKNLEFISSLDERIFGDDEDEDDDGEEHVEEIPEGKYQVGDLVIVRYNSQSHWDDKGQMAQFCGKNMIVESIDFDGDLHFEECPRWFWKESDIISKINVSGEPVSSTDTYAIYTNESNSDITQGKMYKVTLSSCGDYYKFLDDVGDNRTRSKDEFGNMSNLPPSIIDKIQKENLPEYKHISRMDIECDITGLDIVQIPKEPLLTTNLITPMYTADIIKDRMNEKFFTPKKIEEIVSIVEQIETRVEQNDAIVERCEKENSRLADINSNLNTAVERKNKKDTDAAIKLFEEFIAEEKAAFEDVK